MNIYDNLFKLSDDLKVYLKRKRNNSNFPSANEVSGKTEMQCVKTEGSRSTYDKLLGRINVVIFV